MQQRRAGRPPDAGRGRYRRALARHHEGVRHYRRTDELARSRAWRRYQPAARPSLRLHAAATDRRESAPDRRAACGSPRLAIHARRRLGRTTGPITARPAGYKFVGPSPVSGAANGFGARLEFLADNLFVTVAPGDPAESLKHVERLFIQVARDFDAAVPASEILIPPDRGCEEFGCDPRKELRLERRNFLRRRIPHPLAGALKHLQECRQLRALPECFRTA